MFYELMKTMQIYIPMLLLSLMIGSIFVHIKVESTEPTKYKLTKFPSRTNLMCEVGLA